jgi:glycosyltransferase involved in cell wall biosynthesis
MTSPGIIALSHKIANGYCLRGYKGFLTHLRNGAEVDKIRYTDHPSKDIICLGKIETRKQQAKLASICEGKFNVDFVGPITDNSFQPGATCKYLGEWTREEMRDKLTEYKVLVLPSLGEAHALVVPEAIAAGLTVVVTHAARANLYGCPNYKILPDDLDDMIPSLNDALAYSYDRSMQSQWGRERFSWDTILKEYTNIVIPNFKGYHGIHN